MSRLLETAIVTLLAVGCGSTPGALVSPAAGLAPAPPTLPDEPVCDPGALDQQLSPLAIGWPGGLRAELESGLAGEQVVVLAYSCDRVQVLSECAVPGRYGYLGVSPKSESTLIRGRDSIRASLGGVALGLGAELERGAELDLATIQVGRRATTRQVLSREELPDRPACRAATHFVRHADLGAFALTTGSRVGEGAAARLLGQGVEAAAESSEARTRRDGDPRRCEVATSGEPVAGPPPGCRALLRLGLVPIASARSQAELADSSPSDALGCPEGFVLSQGSCAPARGVAAPFLCDPEREVECREQCERGDLPSCDRLARIWGRRLGQTGELPGERVVALRERLEQACTAEQPNVCAILGALEARRAAELLAAAGEQASAEQLSGLRPLFARAYAYFERSCVAGERRACQALERLYGDPEQAALVTGVEQSRARYLELLERGCRSRAHPRPASFSHGNSS